MTKNVEKIEDVDVRLFAKLYRLLVRLMWVAIVILLGYNTFMIGNVGYTTYKYWNDNTKLENYIVELNTENFVYQELNTVENQEDFIDDLDLVTVKGYAILQCVITIVFEIYLIILFIYYMNISNLITNESLANPFTKENERYLSNSIKLGIAALVLGSLMGNLGVVTFETLLVLSLIRYIIRKGQTKKTTK